MKTARRRRRLGTVLFFAPIIVIIVAVAYALFSSSYISPGKLIVSAQTSAKYYPSVWLNVTTQVGTSSGITPLHLIETQGIYTVHFVGVPWLYTPADRVVEVPAGQTSYVVGVYSPIVRTILIENNQFNSTLATAAHGITPVIFANSMSSYVLIESGPTGRVSIPPHENFTFVFPQSGEFACSLPLVGSPTMTVSVV